MKILLIPLFAYLLCKAYQFSLSFTQGTISGWRLRLSKVGGSLCHAMILLCALTEGYLGLIPWGLQHQFGISQFVLRNENLLESIPSLVAAALGGGLLGWTLFSWLREEA